MKRFFAVVAAALLAACSKPAFNNVDITGANYANAFSLTDHTGAKRTLADYRGKLVVIFFGFTQCPDVCPTTLQEMAEVRRSLGADADRVQVLFVTVDPERDTREVLAQYVPAFDPTFVGLYGSADETARTAKNFKVFYQKVPGPTETSYTMDHTAGSYVIDTTGQPRLFLRHNQGPAPIVADLRRLLSN
jgi:protein SCO1/2